MTFWKTPNDLQVIVDAWSGRWAIVKVPFTRIEFAIFITKRRPASSGEEKVPPTKICSNSQEKEVGAN